jgi:hypothetical protein
MILLSTVYLYMHFSLPIDERATLSFHVFGMMFRYWEIDALSRYL